MTRRLTFAVAALGGTILLVLVVRSFLSSLGGQASDERAGVLLVPPLDALVQPVKAGSAGDAARALAAFAEANPGRPRLAVTWDDAEANVVLVLDREAELVEERRGGASGTRVATVWKGNLAARLAAARSEGRFEAPGLLPPEQKNLYH